VDGEFHCFWEAADGSRPAGFLAAAIPEVTQREASMGSSRRPAVAGMFYPGQGETLRSEVRAFLEEARTRAASSRSEGAETRVGRPKALIAPHAGYVYSGPIAASAYALLLPFRDSIRRVVLLGPAHRYPLRGLAASSAESFGTPLGEVPVDREAVAEALELEEVELLDQAHEGEHSLEVHLPFLQSVLGDFSLVPLLVGDVSPEAVAGVLRLLWGGPETLVVVSSDLSHYLPYARANRMDAETARAIEEMRLEDLGYEQACGRIPVAGLLLRAREEGLGVRCVDLRNSGDTAGSLSQVVGYGSFVVS
jgi:AmmeMemoRadiSam system protein B